LGHTRIRTRPLFFDDHAFIADNATGRRRDGNLPASGTLFFAFTTSPQQFQNIFVHERARFRVDAFLKRVQYFRQVEDVRLGDVSPHFVDRIRRERALRAFDFL
jgi:hypothetical protein